MQEGLCVERSFEGEVSKIDVHYMQCKKGYVERSFEEEVSKIDLCYLQVTSVNKLWGFRGSGVK